MSHPQPRPLQPHDVRTVTLQVQEWQVVFTLMSLSQGLVGRMAAQVQGEPAHEPAPDDAAQE